MSFYSPYSQHPAWGQGFSDLINQMMQFMLMKKYMGQGQAQQPTQTLGQTPLPQGNMMGNAQTPWAKQGVSGAQMPSTGQITGNLGQMAPQLGKMTPEQLQMLARVLGLIG